MSNSTNRVGGEDMYFLCSANNTAEDQLAELARLVGGGGTAEKTKPEPIPLLENAPRLEFDLEDELSKAFGSVPYSSPENSQLADEMASVVETPSPAAPVEATPSFSPAIPAEQVPFFQPEPMPFPEPEPVVAVTEPEPVAVVAAPEPAVAVQAQQLEPSVEAQPVEAVAPEVVEEVSQSDLDLGDLISMEFERALEEEANQPIEAADAEFVEEIQNGNDSFEAELARLMGDTKNVSAGNQMPPPVPQTTITPPSEPEIVTAAGVPAVAEPEVLVSTVNDSAPAQMSDFELHQHQPPAQIEEAFVEAGQAHQQPVVIPQMPQDTFVDVAEVSPAIQPAVDPAAEPAVDPVVSAPIVNSEINLAELELDGASSSFYEEQISIPEPHAAVIAAGSRKKGRRAAGSLVAIALVAGVGLAGWNAIGGNSETVPTILASSEPVKVKPKDAGGKVVPNQDQAVYRSVESSKKVAPKQKRLTDNSEKPISVATKISPNTGKTETRIKRDELSTAGGVVLQPRKVRTVVVKPDGTILTNSADTKVETPTLALKPTVDTPELPAAIVPKQTVAAIPAPTKVKTLKPITQTAVKKLEPAKKVTAVKKPEPVQKVAAVKKPAVVKKPVEAVKTTASVNSPYAVQVASQRSPEAAERTYKVLARRYASVFRGKGMDIRRAEIKGKGIYYRARIPAQTKAAARKICGQLKAKGGDCFVTR